MRFSIQVPATTANLGPGFDSAGIALHLYNTFHFDLSHKDGVHFYDAKHAFKTSLTLDTIKQVLAMHQIAFPANIHLETVSEIPVACGLGSSSTCIVAGIMAANHIGKLNLSLEAMSQLATKIEGHPDNVCPALYGSLCLCVHDKVHYVYKVDIAKDLCFIAYSPASSVSTAQARQALPKHFPIKDVVYSLSRATLLMAGFQSGDLALLEIILSDRIHEPTRKQMIPHYDQLIHFLHQQGIPCTWISGSGPTIMALSKHTKKPLDYQGLNGLVLRPCTTGAILTTSFD